LLPKIKAVSFYAHGFYQKQKAAGDPPARGITCDFLVSHLTFRTRKKAFLQCIQSRRRLPLSKKAKEEAAKG
jgi:hypothetical protein